MILLTETIRCLLLCAGAMVVGDCIVRAVTLLSEVLDERKRIH